MRWEMDVWDRVFGEALRVDNVPTGASPYAPVFRRIGRLSIGRQVFYSPRRIYGDVSVRYYEMKARGREVRKVVFLSKGEPTLDANLGREAKALISAGFRLEVLTYGAILWREDVREDLSLFHRVVLGVGAVGERAWREVMRPHPLLNYEKVVEGMEEFAKGYGGRLDAVVWEVEGIDEEERERIRRFLQKLGVRETYTVRPDEDPLSAL